MTKRNQLCPCGSNIKHKRCCGSSQANDFPSSSPADQQAQTEKLNDNFNVQEHSNKKDHTSGNNKDKPESPQEHYNLGCTYIEQNMLEDAVACFQKALSMQPAAEVYYNLAVIQEKLGNFTDAIVNFQEALRLRPDFKIVHLPLGDMFFKNGNLQEAINCYKKAISYDHNHAETYNSLGIALKEMGLLEEAADNFRKALSLESDYAEAYCNLGVVLCKQGRPEEAIDCYQKALFINPSLSEAYYNLGSVYKEQRQYQKAADCFIKSLSIDPNCPRTFNNLGIIYKKQGVYPEASEYFHKALSIDPEYYLAMHNLGIINKKLLRYEEAAECFKKVLTKNPEYLWSLYGLGKILQAQGEIEEATTCFNKALALKPDFPDAQANLAILSWIKGDWEACRNYLDRISNSSAGLSEKDTKFVVPYLNFLDKLLKYRESNAIRYLTGEKLPRIYVFGDSHCLPTAHTKVNFKNVDYFAEAKIVIGCKAWHLGNKENNRFKYEFENLVDSIPSGSIAVLMFGEIDCRVEEGIIKNYKKNNDNLTESITHLVENYFNYILKITTTRDIFPIICNVPARHIEEDDLSYTDKELQKRVLATFNQALEDNVARKKITLLDVYTITKIRKKGSDNKCHIDGVHFLPSVFENLIAEIQ